MDGPAPAAFQPAQRHREGDGGSSLADTGGTQDWASDFRQDDYESLSHGGDGAEGMSDRANEVRDKATKVTAQAQKKASAVAGQAQEKAGQMKEQAERMASDSGEQFDQMTDRAGSAATNVADKLRERAGQDGPQAQVAGKVADTVEQAGSYLQDHDANEMWDDVETWVRDHPAQALFGALAAGFVLGRAMR
jgi:ElaB/YqjD/DUF883 family membrane-anchored ribosome-binding protein